MGFPISSDIFGQLKWLVKQVKLLQANVIRSVKIFSPSVTVSAGVAQGTIISPTLTAIANGNQLVGLDINPTFVPGSFTGTNQLSLRIPSGGKIGVLGSTTYSMYFSTIEVAINAPGSSGNINFQIADGQKARITTNGNLLINTTTDVLAADKLQIDVNINLITEGNKLKIKATTLAAAGAHTAGTVTLSGATTTVSTTLVTATSIILLTTQSVAGTAGFLVVSARSAGSSFTITSSTGTSDTSTVGWLIIN